MQSEMMCQSPSEHRHYPHRQYIPQQGVRPPSMNLLAHRRPPIPTHCPPCRMRQMTRRNRNETLSARLIQTQQVRWHIPHFYSLLYLEYLAPRDTIPLESEVASRSSHKAPLLGSPKD